MANPVQFRNQFVIYGDGTMVQFIRKKLNMSPEGMRVWRFLLKPGAEAIWRYHLRTDVDIDENGLIVRDYPAHMVRPLDDDPNHARILVKTDLNNRPTELARERELLTNQIENLEEINASLKAWNARLQEEMKLLAGNFDEHLKMSVDRVKLAREAAAQNRGDDMSTEYEDYSEGENMEAM